MTIAMKNHAGGQVAFSQAADAFSNTHAWFYDGNLYQADGIDDNGAIVAESNTGPVLLAPDSGRGHGAGERKGAGSVVASHALVEGTIAVP